MPGRHRGSGAAVEPKLTRKQATLAARVLRALWSPEHQGTAPSDEEKARIHREINAAFVRAGHKAEYSARKLSDAISNRMYTWRLAQRKQVPQSWAAGARANRRKRNQKESQQIQANGVEQEHEQKHEQELELELELEKEREKEKEKEHGMVTPRGTASLIDSCGCDADIFGVPVVVDDFVCTVDIPALPTDLQMPSVVTTTDDSWNILSTMDSMDVLPAPSTSPVEQTDAGALTCATDMTYSVASDCSNCSAVEPLDDLDLLLERAHMDINLDGIELCELGAVSEQKWVNDAQNETKPPKPEESVVHNPPTIQADVPDRVWFENEFENPTMTATFKTVKPKAGRRSPSEPQRKLRKIINPQEPWRDPNGKTERSNQALVEAQMEAFERFEAPNFPAAAFDPTPLAPQRRVLGTLNPKLNGRRSAPAA